MHFSFFKTVRGHKIRCADSAILEVSIFMALQFLLYPNTESRI
jgi:hypothetical protein